MPESGETPVALARWAAIKPPVCMHLQSGAMQLHENLEPRPQVKRTTATTVRLCRRSARMAISDVGWASQGNESSYLAYGKGIRYAVF